MMPDRERRKLAAKLAREMIVAMVVSDLKLVAGVIAVMTPHTGVRLVGAAILALRLFVYIYAVINIDGADHE